MKRLATVSIHLPDDLDLARLFGSYDQHLKVIERMIGVSVRARGRDLHIRGPQVVLGGVREVVDGMVHRLRAQGRLSLQDVVMAVQRHVRPHEGAKVDGAARERPAERAADGLAISTRKTQLTPKTPGQRQYIEAIRKHDVVIGIGPAGTGKTYLAMGMAVAALLNREVNRIILARPAVEAGERLGFLPGDLYAKVNPFVRPLYDALYDMMEVDQANRLIERGDIEIVPLAYMRGRTLNDAFIILDEAQNATAEQMKMFLTRMGFRSRVVVTGDITQVDLPSERASGLVEVQSILGKVPGIRFVYFTDQDVVRHPLLQEILRAYDHYETKRGRSGRQQPRRR